MTYFEPKKFLATLIILSTTQLVSQDLPTASPTKQEIKTEAIEAAQTELNKLRPQGSNATVSNQTELIINSTVLFELQASDESSLVDFIEYKVKNGDYIKYTAPISLSEEGNTQITYRAVDKAGNVEPAKVLVITVDNTAPSITLIPGEPIYTIDGNSFASRATTFTLRAEDKLTGISKVEYSVNNGSSQEYKSEEPFKLEKNGPNLIKFSATDLAGNKSQEASAAIIIDDVKPFVEILPQVPLVVVNGKSYTKKTNRFVVRAVDNESGLKRVLYRFKGTEEFQPFVEPIAVPTDGEVVIEAKAIDNVGNESELVTLPFFVDVVTPSSLIKRTAVAPSSAPAPAE